MRTHKPTPKPRPSHPRRAFTLVEIMITLGIIAIILVIAVPGWIRQRELSQARVCQQNLKSIDDSKEMLALEENLEPGTLVTWADLYDPLDRSLRYIDHFPVCPVGGNYTINPVSTPPLCSMGLQSFGDGSANRQHRLLGLAAPTPAGT